MRPVSDLLLIAIACLFCFAAPSIGEEQKTDIDGILTNFPGYHLLTLKERDPDLRAYLLQHFPKSNPSAIHADFDGDGHLDYALLLKEN